MAGRWAIGQCRRYLWGGHFYWLCDCNSLKELLDYTGDIHQICRIAQELLGYFFTFVHRPARMMRDVDGLNRFYDPLVRLYDDRREAARNEDRQSRPNAYDPLAFPSHAIKCPAQLTTEEHTLFPSVGSTQTMSVSATLCHPAVPTSCMNYPIRVITVASESRNNDVVKVVQSASSDIVDQCYCPPGWISVGSRFGSLSHAFMRLNPTMNALPCLLVESSVVDCRICQAVSPSASIAEADAVTFLDMLLAIVPGQGNQPKVSPSESWDTVRKFCTAKHGVTGIDIHAPPLSSVLEATKKLSHALRIVKLLQQLSTLRCYLFTVPVEGNMLSTSDMMSSLMVQQTYGNDEWNFRCFLGTVFMLQDGLRLVSGTTGRATDLLSLLCLLNWLPWHHVSM